MSDEKTCEIVDDGRRCGEPAVWSVASECPTGHLVAGLWEELSCSPCFEAGHDNPIEVKMARRPDWTPV